MKILQLHADFIEYKPVKKEIKEAEKVEKKKYRFENILVLFTCVERDDNKDVVKDVIREIKEFTERLKINKILIYPFAHLSDKLAEAKSALEILKEMKKSAKKLKAKVYSAPFGWTKELNIKIKAHPLAEQLRQFSLKETKKRKIKFGKRATIKKEKLSKYDHRIIGTKLDLYSFHEAAPGMVFFHHKGMILRNILIDFWRKVHRERGYLEINTPILLDKKLWEISGHLEHYRDFMFLTEIEKRDFALKPMNCPGAILVYKSKIRSYKDLPLRLCELGLVCRNELSGVLTGLFRLRVFTQDDAHIFLTPEQIEDEILKIIELVDYFYKIFGFKYKVELSTKPKKAMGSEKLWKKAENALKTALEKKKIKYKINPGEGAFYGPKIDFHVKDSLGRYWQLATIQLDFQMPERFDISYIGKDGKDHRAVIIHRVIYGAIERFIGILVEHYKGALPLWLSPIQVRVIPVSDKNVRYAKKIEKSLIGKGIRCDGDYEANTLEYKIREAQLQKIPYMIVVGKKEEKDKTITIRDRKGKVKYGVKLKDFIKQIKKEVSISLKV